ncbi:hypothetical protein [Bradyrhizobium sp. HKCCYLS20291]|uniref:hypothetical protein n=1 Tax=Bradyrhizobium sp. HKCCYLS20291 TaxID=3420766 RepID=UPI003EC06043
MFLKLHELRFGRWSRPDACLDNDLFFRVINRSEVPLDLIYNKYNVARQASFKKLNSTGKAVWLGAVAEREAAAGTSLA